MAGPMDDAIQDVMVQAAATAIMPRFQKLSADEISLKDVTEVVTVADRESEAILAEGLARIMPDALSVGEEAVDRDPAITERIKGSLCWIIDPLDGTANFASGNGPFGIMVALASEGRPVGGWILDPRSGRFCAAREGKGTFINNVRVQARPTGRQVPSVAISSLFLNKERYQRLLSKLGDHFELVPIPRCAAEQYPRMIEGQNDVTLFERTLPWDHAAGALCLMEAGGKVTRFDGSPYRVDDDGRGLIAGATAETWERAHGLLSRD